MSLGAVNGSEQAFSAFDLYQSNRSLFRKIIVSSPNNENASLSLTSKEALLFFHAKNSTQYVPTETSLKTTQAELKALENSLIGKVANWLKSENPILKLIHKIFMAIIPPYKKCVNSMAFLKVQESTLTQNLASLKTALKDLDTAAKTPSVNSVSIKLSEAKSLVQTFFSQTNVGAQLFTELFSQDNAKLEKNGKEGSKKENPLPLDPIELPVFPSPIENIQHIDNLNFIKLPEKKLGVFRSTLCYFNADNTPISTPCFGIYSSDQIKKISIIWLDSNKEGGSIWKQRTWSENDTVNSILIENGTPNPDAISLVEDTLDSMRWRISRQH